LPPLRHYFASSEKVISLPFTIRYDKYIFVRQKAASLVCTRNQKMKKTKKTNKEQLSLTNRATHCITANVLQTNEVDAQCDKLDKLATELN